MLDWFRDRKFLCLMIGFVLLITSAWTLKTVYFVHQLHLSPHVFLILAAATAFALVIVSPLIIRKSYWMIHLAFFIYLLFSLILYADVVYERYYSSILHIELIGQASQSVDVSDSILSLIYRTDFFYWIDLPFIYLACFYFNRMFVFSKRVTCSKTLLTSGLTMTGLLSIFAITPEYSDQYKVSITGVIPAHVNDLAHAFEISTQAGTPYQYDQLQKQFKDNQDTQKTSPFFGRYKGKNIIMIQAESLNNFPIGLKVGGKEVTPNLNKLVAESHYYPNIYLQIGRGNTSDAEFVANNSIYPIAPKGVYKGYPNNDFVSLPNILKESGYSTSATHGNTPEFWNRQEAYKKQGFSTFYSKGHPAIKDDETIGLGISDESIFKQMIRIYPKQKKPFYNFIISLTNHRPFEMPKKYQYLSLPANMNNTSTGNYLKSVHYFDKTLGTFIKDLKKEKLWDQTIFVVYGDHYGPIPNDEAEIKKLLNITFDQKTRFNIPLIIHHPGQTKGVINKVTGSQMDIFPTITSLLGIKQPLVQFGQSLDSKHNGFVGFAYETTRYTFYSDRFDYLASHDGKFEFGKCIDNKTKITVNVNACKDGFEKVKQDINTSDYLLKGNLIAEVFKVKEKGKSANLQSEIVGMYSVD